MTDPATTSSPTDSTVVVASGNARLRLSLTPAALPGHASAIEAALTSRYATRQAHEHSRASAWQSQSLQRALGRTTNAASGAGPGRSPGGAGR